ncbi:MAG: NAD regulator [Proteobacteria bacterium]|nr:NAD regulator [Pseudomonadota bacterium]
MTRDTGPSRIEIGLAAAIVTVRDDEPLVFVTDTRSGNLPALPSGPFDPVTHRTFEIGLRAWVNEQAGLNLGYAEQLYTFGDRGRHAQPGDVGPHVVSVGYLALTGLSRTARGNTEFLPWYRFLPWEDWRGGRPRMIDEIILPALRPWASQKQSDAEITDRRGLSRFERMKLCFGGEGAPFDEEKALERYELLYEAGLVMEAIRDGRADPSVGIGPGLGMPMSFDHRRILATAIGRLRGKLKYRPVIFELIPAEFTLTSLQNTVEAISGRLLHKQNFRRLVETSQLVEPTGGRTTTGGRPAALFRFRREVLAERPAPGIRVGSRG